MNKNGQLLYQTLNIINRMLEDNELFSKAIRRVLLEVTDINSFYWSLSSTTLAAIEEQLENLIIESTYTLGKGKEKTTLSYPAIDVIKTMHSQLHVQLAFNDVDLKVLTQTYTEAMEKSVRPLNVEVGVESTFGSDESVRDRYRVLVNQGWLFTLCLTELAISNVSMAQEAMNLMNGRQPGGIKGSR